MIEILACDEKPALEIISEVLSNFVTEDHTFLCKKPLFLFHSFELTTTVGQSLPFISARPRGNTISVAKIEEIIDDEVSAKE